MSHSFPANKVLFTFSFVKKPDLNVNNYQLQKLTKTYYVLYVAMKNSLH